jgi:transcriptional regulator with XRE-family HTH domain
MTTETLQQATKALLGAGMTLQEIANLCGVSRPAVMAWSSGKSNAYGAHPFWKIGPAALALRYANEDLAYITKTVKGRCGQVIHVTRRHETPNWLVHLAVAHASTWPQTIRILPQKRPGAKIFKTMSPLDGPTPVLHDVSDRYAPDMSPETYDKETRAAFEAGKTPGTEGPFTVLDFWGGVGRGGDGTSVELHTDALYARVLSRIRGDAYDGERGDAPEAFYG